MSTTSSTLSVSDLPGIDTPTTVTDLPSDAAASFSADAKYIRLREGSPSKRHIAAGEVLLFCVAGEMEVEVDGQPRAELHPNQMLHIPAGISYRVHALAESALLVTSVKVDPSSCQSDEDQMEQNLRVDEASEESFPASDPPSFNATCT